MISDLLCEKKATTGLRVWVKALQFETSVQLLRVSHSRTCIVEEKGLSFAVYPEGVIIYAY